MDVNRSASRITIPIVWAKREELEAVFRRAVEAETPLDVLDDWLEAREGASARGTRDFDRLSGQLVNNYLDYVRENNGGELPTASNPHSSAVERIELVCAYRECDVRFEVLPCEKNAGRKYCSPACASRAQAGRKRRDVKAQRERAQRNRWILERAKAGWSARKIGAHVNLTDGSVRRIIRRGQP